MSESAVRPTLSPTDLEHARDRWTEAQARLLRTHPGPSDRRQAVHTVYGGAHLFRADTAARLGELARRSLEAFAPDGDVLAQILRLPTGLAGAVYSRVREKLEREPVEDFRIDFEDGYGNRPDAEEDAAATAAAGELARALAAGTAPPFRGLRIKPLSLELAPRSVRTLDLFVTGLVKASGSWPAACVVTLPKITHPDQVTALADVLDVLEKRLGLTAGTIPIELMIETPQSIFTADGRIAPPALVEAGRGRVGSAHFGTYDYTASLDITASQQHMAHPSCDFAKQVLLVSLAGTGVHLSDGATNVLPVQAHRATEEAPLSSLQEAENRRVVHDAWRLHYAHVRHSLVNAYYQGWDLHPAQLPTRYAAVYAFFLEGLDAAAERLKNFVGKAAQATLVGDVFDDAATGQGLLNYFLRAINCGAIGEEEVAERTGLALEDLRERSFVRILERRSGRSA